MAGVRYGAAIDMSEYLEFRVHSEERFRQIVQVVVELQRGFFGGASSLERMSWVKPNFLWMMYRSDRGRSPNQEVVLAVRLRRTFFDSLRRGGPRWRWSASTRRRMRRDLGVWSERTCGGVGCPALEAE